MVIETHTPMQCSNCGENVKRLKIDDFYGGIVCVVDPKPVSSTNAGVTYQEHVCDLESSKKIGLTPNPR